VEFTKGKAGAIEDVFGTEDLFNEYGEVYDRVFKQPDNEDQMPYQEAEAFARRLAVHFRSTSAATRQVLAHEDNAYEQTIALAAEARIKELIDAGLLKEVEPRTKSPEVDGDVEMSDNEPEVSSRPPAPVSLIRRPRESPEPEGTVEDLVDDEAEEVSEEDEDEESEEDVVAGVVLEKEESSEEEEPAPEFEAAPSSDEAPVQKKARRSVASKTVDPSSDSSLDDEEPLLPKGKRAKARAQAKASSSKNPAPRRD
jgi:hypothetical protein